MRAALGLGDRGTLTFTHEPMEVDAALKQFVRDALPRQDGKPPLVNSRSKSADWRDYGRSLHDRGLAPKTALAEPAAPPKPAKAEPKKPRGSKHPSDRSTIIPTSFVSKRHIPGTLCKFLSRADTLHRVRALGNDAAHEVKKHTHAQLTITLNIIEHLLDEIYILPAKTAEAFKTLAP